MKRIGALLVAVLGLVACGHPGVPVSALKPTRTSPPQLSPSVQPVLGVGVDLYALSDYPSTVVKADGERMLAYIKNVLRANSVGIVWNFYAPGPHANAVQASSATLSARNVGILTRIAIRDHLIVEYRPLIMVSGVPNSWEGRIRPGDPIQWFKSYLGVELPYLRLAQRLGVREFVAATEMHRLNNSPLWSSFFAQVADIYHGVISYAAWDGDYLPAGKHLLPVKYFGMDMYRPLRLPANATSAEVTAAWANMFKQMPASILQRTTIDETGIQARAGAYYNPPALYEPGQLNEQVQANWYSAACATVRRYHMRGVFFWKVDLTDYPAHPATSLSTFEGKEGALAISECAQILH